jgi:hypothetical protein
VLQVAENTSDPHPAPPWAAATRTDRVRRCDPDPHVAEQVSNNDHSERRQSTGHSLVLHTRETSNGQEPLSLSPPTVPPPCSMTFTGRVWTPLPHDLVQGVQGM